MNFKRKITKAEVVLFSEDLPKETKRCKKEKKMLKRTRVDLEPWMKQMLLRWAERHHNKPYPSDKEKQHLAMKLGLSKKQVSVWFINYRRVSS